MTVLQPNTVVYSSPLDPSPTYAKLNKTVLRFSTPYKDSWPISSAANDSQPSADVDGKRLFFVRGFGSRPYAFGGHVPASYGIFRLDPNSTASRKIMAEDWGSISLFPGCCFRASIYFTGQRHLPDASCLYRIQGHGIPEVLETFPKFEPWCVTVSTDGTKLAYMGIHESKCAIFTSPSKIKNWDPIFKTEGYVSQVRFSRDGKHLFIAIDDKRDENYQILDLDLKTKKTIVVCSIFIGFAAPTGGFPSSLEKNSVGS